MSKSNSSGTLRRLASELAALDAQSNLRRLAQMEGINLCSNDYLGVSADARLREAITAALAAGLPVASTGSRLLSGNAAIWEELEADFARFIGTEAALFFGSGYAANVGLLSALLHPEDIVFSDQANHASIVDGIRLSRARKVIFPHLDLNSLENALRHSDAPAGQKFIVVESVFSMDGDRAPVNDLLEIAERCSAELIVDEAHATGVFGPQGRGLVAAAGGTRRVLATVHPCGKALASAGGFVCCAETLKQYLVNRARSFIFSTALPPYFAAQIRRAVTIISESDAERRRLESLASCLRQQLQEAGFNIGTSDTQIVPVILGGNDTAIHYAAALSGHGFAVRPIRPPTVPQGQSRLRLSVTAKLSDEAVDRLVNAVSTTRIALPL
ncbi:MAG: 8-amino-7-oxononanoate synthase [Acidobacteria bacterium]|nr:8-amino-7-oxononanoate synthase [Acidobacteriota bacterium]